MTPTASDNWWQRSLDRLGVKTRSDNDAAQIAHVAMPPRLDENDSLHYHYNTLKAFGGDHA